MMKMRPQMSLMMKMNRFTVHLNIVLSLGLAFTACGVVLATYSTPAAAQKRAPIERIAQGQVVNKAGVPIAGAVVYLKDSHSNSIRTYIADNSGNFRFGNLSQNTDYQLWANSNGVRSKSRDISSFDSENSFQFTLKIDASR